MGRKPESAGRSGGATHALPDENPGARRPAFGGDPAAAIRILSQIDAAYAAERERLLAAISAGRSSSEESGKLRAKLDQIEHEIRRLHDRVAATDRPWILRELGRMRRRLGRSVKKRIPWARSHQARPEAEATAAIAAALPPLPPPTPVPVALDAEFSMPLASWREVAGAVLATVPAPAEDCRPLRLHIVLDATAEGVDPDAIDRTLVSLKRLAAAGGNVLGCAVVAGATEPQMKPAALAPGPAIDFAAALDGVPDDELVWFARPGDALRAEASRLLSGSALSAASIILADGALVSQDRAWPLLMPGADYLHALNCDYFRSRFFARAGPAREAIAAGAASPRDIALRLLGAAYAAAEGGAVSTGLPLLELHEDPQALRSERRRVATEMAAVLPMPDGGSRRSTDLDAPRVGRVTAIICTKDRGFLLRQLAARLLDEAPRLIDEVVIVSNGSANAHALQTLSDLGESPRVRILPWDAPFNFSLQSNLGAAEARGDILLFINDDVVPVAARWLDELVAPFANPRIGIVGPLLLYPDESVQHAGMFLGHGGVGGHHLRRARLPEGDYFFFASAPRRVSSVTGATMAVRRDVFERLDGFDPLLAHWIQDVDLCLRAADAGYEIIYTPRSTLLHMESLTVAETLHLPAVAEARARDLEHFTRRWGSRAAVDPFHPALFSREDRSLRTLVPPAAGGRAPSTAEAGKLQSIE